jgi:hypothetical protein
LGRIWESVHKKDKIPVYITEEEDKIVWDEYREKVTRKSYGMINPLKMGQNNWIIKTYKM